MGPALRRRPRLSISSLRKRVLSCSRCLPWTRMWKCHLWAIPELRTWDRANTSPDVRSSCHTPWPMELPFPRLSPTFCLLSSSCSAKSEKLYPDTSKVSHFLFQGCVLSNLSQYIRTETGPCLQNTEETKVNRIKNQHKKFCSGWGWMRVGGEFSELSKSRITRRHF